MKIRYILVLGLALAVVFFLAFELGEKPDTPVTVQPPSKVESGSRANEESKKVVRLAVEEYAPFTSEKLPGKGLLSIVVREAFELEGISSEITFYPGSRAFNEALTGSSDGTYNWADREERHKHFYYSDWLMVAEKELFFFKKGHKFRWDAKKQDYSELAGKSIAANIGYNYGVKFQEAEKNKIINVFRVSTMEQAFSMLLAGRVEMYIHFDMVGRHFVNNNLTAEQKSQVDDILAFDRPTEYDYVLFSRKAKNGKYFLEAFNRGLKKLKESGRYEQIFRTWFTRKDVQSKTSE